MGLVGTNCTPSDVSAAGVLESGAHSSCQGVLRTPDFLVAHQPGKSEAPGWDLASVSFIFSGDSHMQARSRPRLPPVLACSRLGGFAGLRNFNVGIGPVQANWDETSCITERQPWICHGEHPGDPHFLTEASFHVSLPMIEQTKLGELELRGRTQPPGEYLQPEVHPHVWL